MTHPNEDTMSGHTADGGEAFACASENGHQPGMSLRDYFAAHALGFMGHVIALPGITVSGNGVMDAAATAEAAYEIADAMLAHRSHP